MRLSHSWSYVFAALFVLNAGTAVAQTRIVTGKVSDSLTNEAVTSGQVSVVGTTVSATIRDDGTFTIALPARDVVLSIRSIGFKRLDVPVAAGQTSVLSLLARDYFQLEAIVVTGQATGVARRNLANAVSTVTADNLIKGASVTVDQALLGKVAGVQINGNNGGAPGGGMEMHMRGMASLLGNSRPLWVVDGVIINNQEIGSGMNQVTRGGGQSCAASGATCGSQDVVVNRAADLNPNDIESVEVLKGASAAAIYGSKANAGVIVITTKRGRVGAPQFSLTQRVGYSEILKRVGPFRRFGSAAEGAATFGPEALLSPAQGGWTADYFDHEMEVFGGKPLSYETIGSISGGTDNTRYFASGLVKHDGGILLRTFADKQSLRLNVDQQIGSRIDLSLNTNAIHTRRNPGFTGNDNFEVSMYFVVPATPTWMDIRQICNDGTRARAGSTCKTGGIWPVMPFANSNPLESATIVDVDEHVYRMINGGRLAVKLLNSATNTLQLSGTGGTDFYSKKDFIFSPATLQFEPLDGFPGTVVQSGTFVNQMNATGVLVHTFKPSSGAFSATTQAGASYEIRAFNFSQIWARNLTSGVADIDETTNQIVQQTQNRVRDAGYFAQEEFLTLREKLLLTAGIRADQSSTNSDAAKLYYFPKAAASYRFAAIKGILDELKFRAAYGQSGNQPQYGDKFTSLSTANINAIPTASLGTTLIDSLHPERQTEFEAGVDATMLGGRSNLEVTGYYRRISDLLINRTLVSSTGFSAARFNGATIGTKGIEVALTVIPVQSRTVQWQTRATFSKDQTKTEYLPVPPFESGGGRFEVGKIVTERYGNDTLPNGTPYRLIIGDNNPKFIMGFQNDLKVKSLSLNMVWDWQNGGFVSNFTGWTIDIVGTSRDYNEPCVGNCLPGETLGGQRARLYPGFVSRIRVEDGSFLKLREATIGFEVPKSFINHFWSAARHVRLSVSGRNLLMFTPYWGSDPEVRQSGSGALRTNGDVSPYPSARTLFFSVDVGF